mmetsp:Transcript_43994/g.79085  ORF Transcript_43994/g.79085 Transcript_43994/m.79085 type:complete len:343 (-) Transcript_43994:7-1035(-)
MQSRSRSRSPLRPGVAADDQLAPPLKPVRHFEIGDADSLQHLQQHGYVVYRDALSQLECEKATNLVWEYLEHFGVLRNREETWHEWPPAVAGAGILAFGGVGQCRALWYVRTRERVLDAFAHIWKAPRQDLICSFDGCVLFRPWKENPSWKTRGSWYHVDQHPTRPEFECVQGLVNLVPVSAATGGNVLVPGSHLKLNELAEKYPEQVHSLSPGEDFFPIPSSEPLLKGAIMPELAQGDLLLWDSRTIHCSAPGFGGEKPGDGSGLLRMAPLICMVPRSLATPKVLEQRRKAARNGVSTTHRPHVFQPTYEYNAAKSIDEKWLRPGPELLEERTSCELSLIG